MCMDALKVVLAWLDGKKTYALVICAVILYMLKKHGVDIPDELLAAVVGAAVLALRVGVTKSGPVLPDASQKPDTSDQVK